MSGAIRGPQGSKPFLLGPAEAAHLGAAYEAALLIAQDAGSPFEAVPPRELERRLARLIILAAREGVTDIDQLKARALRTLPTLVVDAPRRLGGRATVRADRRPEPAARRPSP